MGVSMTPQQRSAVYDRALAARARLDRLRAGPDFAKRYAALDPDVIEAFELLVGAIAEGVAAAKSEQVEIETAQVGAPNRDMNVNASEAMAKQQAINAMLADPAFAKRYAAGDLEAVKAWNQASDDRARLLGVDPKGSLVGQAIPQAPQPDQAPIGVAGGGAS